MRAHALRLATFAAAALAALPASAATPDAPALVTVADGLAAALGPPPAERRTVGIVLETGVEGLRGPLETALAGALARRGWAAATLPAPGGDAEADARARGLDWLLRVRGGLAPGGRELALVGEAIPVWTSFFLQRRPGIRPAPPRLAQARAAADPEALLLARPPRPLDPARVAMRTIATMPGRVLALAVGELTPGSPAIVAVRDDRVSVLSPRGEPVAERPIDSAPPVARRPIRAAAATAAAGDFGDGRAAWSLAGAEGGEVLALAAGPDGAARLVPVASLAAAPLCAGGAGPLYGRFVPGTSALADVLWPQPDPAAAPASARRLVGVACAPGGGPVAYGVLDADHRLALLDPSLAPAAPPIDGVGAGFALADLDADGVAELVASAAVARAPDRVRLVAARGADAPLWTSDPLPGLVLAGAAGDLTGDGADDALLAAVETLADGAVRTALLLVTADPREAP